MGFSPNGVDRINSFALVSYLPGALGQFVDQLRKDLVPNCMARSHVTLLPPRALVAHPEDAQRQLEKYIAELPPFEIELGRVEVFPGSNVIYLELSQGRQEIERIHLDLNRNTLSFDEPYAFHPHVTLAQGLLPEQLDPAFDLALSSWRDYPYSRRFLLDHMTFVQNTSVNNWIDLMYYMLHQPVPMHGR